jgi:hypothetical protein
MRGVLEIHAPPTSLGGPPVTRESRLEPARVSANGMRQSSERTTNQRVALQLDERVNAKSPCSRHATDDSRITHSCELHKCLTAVPSTASRKPRPSSDVHATLGAEREGDRRTRPGARCRTRFCFDRVARDLPDSAFPRWTRTRHTPPEDRVRRGESLPASEVRARSIQGAPRLGRRQASCSCAIRWGTCTLFLTRLERARSRAAARARNGRRAGKSSALRFGSTIASRLNAFSG